MCMSTLLNLYVIITAAGFHTFLQSYNTITELSNIFFYCNPPLFIPVFFCHFRAGRHETQEEQRGRAVFHKIACNLGLRGELITETLLV